jgi:hypothetical protein
MPLIVTAIAFTFFLVGSALAQGQPTSCSMGAQLCNEQLGRQRSAPTVDATSCDKAYTQCMKTGVWTGPASGRSWPVTKN